MAEQQAAAAEADEPLNTAEQGHEQEQGTDREHEQVEVDDRFDELATEMGWKPQDQYKGDPANWKPAKDFILAGHDIQKSTAKELKGLRSTIDNMARTTASIVEQQVAEKRKELEEQYSNAVDDGDAEGARKISKALDQLETKVAAPGLSPAASDFAEKHKAWLGVDPLATDRAVAVAAAYAKAGKTEAEQLEAAERTIKKEFPELFPAPAKRQASTEAPNRQSSAPSRKKGYADLPAEARKVADDMADRGLCTKEQYAENYFKQPSGAR